MQLVNQIAEADVKSLKGMLEPHGATIGVADGTSGDLPYRLRRVTHNDSPYRVTDARLQVEGLDADHQPVGRTLAWAIGDIAPGGETSFVTEPMPGAVSYRITVVSYDLVSLGLRGIRKVRVLRGAMRSRAILPGAERQEKRRS